jgi:hypothetical protein
LANIERRHDLSRSLHSRQTPSRYGNFPLVERAGYLANMIVKADNGNGALEVADRWIAVTARRWRSIPRGSSER